MKKESNKMEIMMEIEQIQNKEEYRRRLYNYTNNVHELMNKESKKVTKDGEEK